MARHCHALYRLCPSAPGFEPSTFRAHMHTDGKVFCCAGSSLQPVPRLGSPRYVTQSKAVKPIAYLERGPIPPGNESTARLKRITDARASSGAPSSLCHPIT